MGFLAKRYCTILYIICFGLTIQAQRRCITIDDLFDFKYITDCVLSPDGEWIALTMIRYQDNIINQDIFLLNRHGGSGRQLTTHSGFDGSPSFSPDGSLLAFISDRSGTRQIHVLPLDGGEAHAVSDIKNGVLDFLWSPDGDFFAFTAKIDIQSSKTLACSLNTELNVNCYEHLPCQLGESENRNRHTHIFIMPFSGGKAWDLTPENEDTPSFRLSSDKAVSFSPDGREVAFTRNVDSLQFLSTNNDICLISSKGGTLRQISINRGNDNYPVFSPDGKYIAYRSMNRARCSSAQYDLMLYNKLNGRLRNLTEGFDLDVCEYIWAPSGDRIYYTAQDQGRNVIFTVDIKTNKIRGVLLTGYNSHLMISPDEEQLYFIRSMTQMPTEIFSCSTRGGQLIQLSFFNYRLVNQIEMNPVQDFWFPSYDGKLIHGLLIKPPFFDPAKKYPAILLIHQGSHSLWQDQFQTDWNSQLFASRGHVVIMINMRGSKGYGQAFCDAASENWGGPPYRDLMEGLDYVIKEYQFIDGERIAAAGAFFGGYMVNWIAGHTQRFRCLISHEGIFDLISFYGTTDRLYFPEWEFDGSPYENYNQYEKWSPVKFGKHIKTPTLVIHGARDHRVSVSQSQQMFTALQRNHVQSCLLIFPDEGHIIEKPENKHVWWQTVLNWISDYTQ